MITNSPINNIRQSIQFKELQNFPNQKKYKKKKKYLSKGLESKI